MYKFENGIHHFTLGNSNYSLDEFFTKVEELFKNEAGNEILKYYVDATSNENGRTNMSDLIKRFRRLEVKYPNRPSGRTVLIHHPNALITIGSTIIDTFAPNRDKTKLFAKGKEHEAMTWLINEQ